MRNTRQSGRAVFRVCLLDMTLIPNTKHVLTSNSNFLYNNKVIENDGGMRGMLTCRFLSLAVDIFDTTCTLCLEPNLRELLALAG